MSDDKKKKGQPDRSRISTSESYEVRYWSDKFGISHQRIPSGKYIFFDSGVVFTFAAVSSNVAVTD